MDALTFREAVARILDGKGSLIFKRSMIAALFKFAGPEIKAPVVVTPRGGK